MLSLCLLPIPLAVESQHAARGDCPQLRCVRVVVMVVVVVAAAVVVVVVVAVVVVAVVSQCQC